MKMTRRFLSQIHVQVLACTRFRRQELVYIVSAFKGWDKTSLGHSVTVC